MPQAETRPPASLQLEGPGELQEWRVWCLVLCAPGALAEPPSKKGIGASYAPFLGYAD